MSNGYDPLAPLRADIQRLAADNQTLRQQMNSYAAGQRKAVDERLSAADQKLSDLATIAKTLKGSVNSIFWNRKNIRIEDIPGRRVPFVLIMDIPIQSDTMSVREQSVTIPQEGPFVAVRRMATFQSGYQFEVTDPQTGATARFSGRSFGRYRPIHSAWDLNDAMSDGIVTTSNPMAVGATPSVTSIVSSKSGYRSMEFDGRITFVNGGSSYPRQNIPVPSSMWTPQINAPQDLGALDFFERGEILTVQVQPNHVNNPPFGNVQGVSGAGGAAYPFLGGQYDPHEGIGTLNGFTVTTGPVVTPLTQDPIVRMPDGLLTIGWEGYRIIQPVGPVE